VGDRDFTSLLLELRRGAIVLGILSRLREEHYGYSLREDLARTGMEVNEGTLYPLLRRLESQGLLQSRWDVGGGRPRRYYRISAKGRKALTGMTDEWNALVEAMKNLLED
jgi:DNA-binding PadR family transcriptional regulator